MGNKPSFKQKPRINGACTQASVYGYNDFSFLAMPHGLSRESRHCFDIRS
jgi:hypothetical protein